MLNTSLHNKSARLGGLFTYEKFYSGLNDTISRPYMPESAIVKVSFSERGEEVHLLRSI